MATKKATSAVSKADSASKDTHVTRIKATSSKPKKEAPKQPTTPQTPKKTAKKGNWIRAIGNYFKGAWFELRQVRWPNRKATWSLTGAVLAFTALFVGLIVLLDAGFKLLFEQLLG